MTWVVLAAAGRGERFAGGGLPKQYWPLGRHCVLEHTLLRLLAHPAIAGVVVALAADDQRFERLELARDPRVLRVSGGADRAASVRRALAALPDDVAADAAVLVHDAARPCLDRALLDRLLQHVEEPDGALLALPVVDTLKQAVADPTEPGVLRVGATLDRQRHWLAQTPQLFRRALLQRALDEAAARGLAVTDESMAVEALGLRPRLVPGSIDNRKLTLAEDLAPIERWLAMHPLAEDALAPEAREGTG